MSRKREKGKGHRLNGLGPAVREGGGVGTSSGTGRGRKGTSLFSDVTFIPSGGGQHEDARGGKGDLRALLQGKTRGWFLVFRSRCCLQETR